MPQVIEVRGLTSQQEAERRAEDFRIDDVPVEIVPQRDGTFTVRATYPDDVHIPAAILNSSPSPLSPHVPPPPPPPANAGAKTLSDKGAALVKAFESCLRAVPGGFQAYPDPIGVLTIGWGHTNHHGRNFESRAVWTQAECDAE